MHFAEHVAIPGRSARHIFGRLPRYFPIHRLAKRLYVMPADERGHISLIAEVASENRIRKKVVLANKESPERPAHQIAEEDVMKVAIHRPAPCVIDHDGLSAVGVLRGVVESNGAA